MVNQIKSCAKHGRPDQFQRKLTVALRGVEWVHGLFLFPFVLGKM